MTGFRRFHKEMTMTVPMPEKGQNRLTKKNASPRTPVFTSILDDRKTVTAILLFAFLQILLAGFHLPGWICPIHFVFGIKCPGCGLSTAMAQLCRGNVVAALDTHFLSIVFLPTLFIMALVGLSPFSVKKKAIPRIKRLEEKTRFSAVFLVILIIYSIYRTF